MNFEKKYLDLAIKLATENVRTNRGGPFGAVIVKNNEIVADGVNSVAATNDPTAHAEIVAIRAACSKLSSFQLFNCVVYSSCEPCPMCLGALYWARVSALYFAATKKDAASIGFDDSLIYEEISLPIDNRALITQKIAIQNAQEPFELWSQSKQKIKY